MKSTLSKIQQAEVVKSNVEIINMPAPRSFNKKQKFRKIDGLFKNISDFMSVMPQAEFDTHFETFEKCRDLVSKGTFFTGKIIFKMYNFVILIFSIVNSFEFFKS